MDVQRVAAFSLGDVGGNPAGVVLLDQFPQDAEMARVAAEVGYSETAFAVAQDADARRWRVRYFSPESEVPFCGHATIALGSVLGGRFGPGTFALDLNETSIDVTAERSDDGVVATLSSPPTRSAAASENDTAEVLALFDLRAEDLDDRLPPARIHGGADHFFLLLQERDRLARMRYDLRAGQVLMRSLGLVTIMLATIEDEQTFVARNAFASGGVLEDPATGAAAAAFAGYLRDRRWPHGGRLTIRQGEDMGSPSSIGVRLTDEPGAPVLVSGRTRPIDDHAPR